MGRPAIHKKRSTWRLEFAANTDSSVFGGLPAMEALCAQFGLWEKLRALPGLDRRTRQGRGFGPEVMVARILVPAERLSWWVETRRRLWPKPRPGRPAG